MTQLWLHFVDQDIGTSGKFDQGPLPHPLPLAKQNGRLAAPVFISSNDLAANQ